jgi:hypothetical protein
MKRRIFGLGMSLFGLLPFLSGCTETRPWLRSRSDDQARFHPADDETGDNPDKVLDVKSGTRPFFTNSRLSGGLSSEARDIERSLGIQ